MTESTTGQQIAEQLKAAESALRQLEQMSFHVDELGELLTRRVDTSVQPLATLDRSLGELRDALTTFIQLPNGVERLATEAEDALQQFSTARADLRSAVEANRDIAASVTAELKRSLDDAVSQLSMASAAAAQSIENLAVRSESRLDGAASSLANSAESIAAGVVSMIEGSLRGSVHMLETALRDVRQSAASALDPTIASVGALLAQVDSEIGRISTDLGEINGQGMADLRRSIGEAYGGVEGLLGFAQDRIRGIVDEYRTSVLAVLHQQRQASERTTEVVRELTTLLDRSTEMQTLSARLSEDVELLRRIEHAAGSVKPPLAKRAELALTGAILSGSIALWFADLTLGQALLVVLPAPLLTLWLEPLVSPLISEWRRRRS